MAYSAFAVANAFIERSLEGRLDDLTPMKLQKLMFFAQAWHLKLRDGEPVLDDHFARWRHGPVIPSVFHEFRDFDHRRINDFAAIRSRHLEPRTVLIPGVPGDDEDTWGLVDAVIRTYGRFDSGQLSAITHRPGSVWSVRGADWSVILNEDIARDPTIGRRS